MPNKNELPKSIRPLVARHGISVRPDPDFHRDMDRLIGKLSALVELPTIPQKKSKRASKTSIAMASIPKPESAPPAAPWMSLYDALANLTKELEHVLAPLKGSIGTYYLSTPEDKRWFPYRPGSVAEIEMESYPPKSGKWQDVWFELGWVDGGIGLEPYRPQMVFNSHEGYLFDAMMRPDPVGQSDSLNSTLDGLLYVRDNAARLILLIEKRLEVLDAHGLVGNYVNFRTRLSELADAYSHAKSRS